jgi:hypothetical protein
MMRIRLIVTVLSLSFVASLVPASPAAADNCDIFINPEDCQNTGWTIGVIATLAGGVAVATAATAAGGTKRGDIKRRKPAASPPPPVARRTARDRDEQRRTTEDIDIRSTSDPPSITIQPTDGVVRAHSVTLRAHRDPGSQTAEEVDRGHDSI